MRVPAATVYVKEPGALIGGPTTTVVGGGTVVFARGTEVVVLGGRVLVAIWLYVAAVRDCVVEVETDAALEDFGWDDRHQ
jgi:hypothetical protein